MKAIQMMEFYNMMNDNRHLLIADLRKLEFFEQKQIRGSFCIQNDVSMMTSHIEKHDTNAKKNEEKYHTQPIRRMVIVNDDYQKIEQEAQLIKDLIQSFKMNEYKIYYLKTSVDAFLDKYPFYTFSKTILQNYENLDNNEDQQKVLFAYSQFPQQLQENKLYLGSNLNANSKKQLDALQIKTIIDLKKYEPDAQLSSWKKEQYNYINYPISEGGEQFIDFYQITDLIESQDAPILLCCPDGYSITSVVAIGYLMTLKKQNFNISSLKVFQIRGNTTVNKQLYSQILSYDPKTIVNKIIQQQLVQQ
ncbi:unnamed protein product [Paramecium pentaurelia]|uniref:protein-tyrosine-phosphatase n=1 Tax=Paramecium pentaurelia TaxID=43138 RepID=A0A8S1XPK0_9CILI|nr:unnamed protein product [Paramecium pentaurelia]